jgi:site-specific recombinase XerC
LKRKSVKRRAAWNKGQVVGRKLPLSLKQIHSIRMRLKSDGRLRELALFNLAIDSNLRACDIVGLRVSDVAKGRRVLSRASIAQTGSERSAQFEITGETRNAIAAWIAHEDLKAGKHLFPSRLSESPHVSTRQYARLVASWVESIGLDPDVYGTQSLRRTKPALVYRQTRSLLAAQLLLGHTRPSSTARFLGIED